MNLKILCLLQQMKCTKCRSEMIKVKDEGSESYFFKCKECGNEMGKQVTEKPVEPKDDG